MDGWQIAAIIIALCLVILLVTRCIALANRLDRLHRRMLTTRDELDQLTIQRAELTILMADTMSGAQAVRVRNAAQVCQAADAVLLAQDELDSRRGAPRVFKQQAVVDRWERESVLTRDLRECSVEDVTDVPEPLLTQLVQVCYRIHVARTMHNVDVVQAQHLRSDPLVAIFHLYGSAAAPTSIDFDDDLTQAPVFSVGGLATVSEKLDHE